jgi:ribosomal protein L40E
MMSGASAAACSSRGQQTSVYRSLSESQHQQLTGGGGEEFFERRVRVCLKVPGKLAGNNFRMRSERVLSVFFVSDCPDLHYNGVSLDDLSPSDVMPSNRPNLTLDEQSFQGLLSTAFNNQEYNDRRKLARQTQAEPEADRLCLHCGALMPADASRCGSCGLDEFCPGERMQPNWASMWLMSQEQSLLPQRSPEIRERPRAGVPPLDAERKPLAPAPRDSAGPSYLVLPVAKEAAKETIRQEKTETIHDRAFDTSALDKAEGKSQWITEATKDLTPEDPAPEDAELTVQPFQLSTRLIAGDEPVTNDAGYGHIAVYRWQWSVSFWPI